MKRGKQVDKIAITTDTNSSISPEEAEKLGIHMLPMPFSVDNKEYFEGVNCTYEEFFEMLAKGCQVSTSQPAPEAIISFWNEILKEYDYIVHIPMSASLSSSLATAKALSVDYSGKVFVADNKRISVSQRQSVIDALHLVRKGLSAEEICKTLEEHSYNASIYLAVNTLELLKKSGRVTAAGAAIASILNIKPVLQIQGEKLDAYAKARGMKNAEDIMINVLHKDVEERFAGKPIKVETAYSGDLAAAMEWRNKVQESFPDYQVNLHKLPISISCHVGAGVKALGCIQYIE